MFDNADLVKALREHAEWMGPNNYELPIAMYDDLLKAADAIDELSKLQASYREVNWISTKDRLPECEPGTEVGNITFRLQSGTIESGCFGRGGLQRDEYFRTWTDPCEGWGVESVTHWIKLPDAEVKGQ